MGRFKDIGRIKVFIKDPNKKGFIKMINEVLVLAFTKKEIPFYYFKYLYRKNVENYKDYLSTKELVAIGSKKELHKPEYNALIENKLVFSFFFERTHINTPKLISYNLGVNFFFDGHMEQINEEDSLLLFFERVFDASKVEAIFFRPPSEYGGKGCFKLTKKNFKKELIGKYDEFAKGCLVHTEAVKQHKSIDEIHGKSVSTLRILSLMLPDKTVEIISAFIRFGVGDSVVDNASSGGFVVGVNLEDGTLKDTGHYLIEYGGAEIKTHPDNGFKLGGFKVPFFKEACKEVVKGVTILPDRFIGWDVAIGEDGPVIIEANSLPHIPLSDIAYGGLLKNPHMRVLVKELKTMK